MHPFVLVPLLSCVAAAAMASAILFRDPGQRANRLVALVLVCSAHWSLCEVLWNIQDDPAWVLRLIKLSSFGWLWLGPLTLDIFTEIEGNVHSRRRKLVPLAYASAAACIVLYVATPWCLAEPARTSWGWAPRFHTAFVFVFLPTLAWITLALASWPRFFADEIAPSERRQAAWLFAAILAPVTVSSVTDVLLPSYGIDAVRLGSTSLLVTGALVGWSVQRHGYFLLAPGAFTREILESLRDGVALVGPDGRIRGCNEGFADLLGLTVEELHDQPIVEAVSSEADVGRGVLRNLEIEVTAADGKAIPVSVSSSPVHDDNDHLLGHVVAVRDLREVTTLRQRLVTSGRLAAVGEIAAGIAHEITNPVTFVRANLTQLREHWGTLDKAARDRGLEASLREVIAEGNELIDESLEGIDRISSVVRDVSAFSHAGLGDSALANVNELLERAIAVAALSFSVVIERWYGDVPQVRCDPQQLKQVFFNVLLNSLEAIGDFGKIRLLTQHTGDWVTVRMEDDGPGIPDGVIDRIFDPFFTTRPGRGLGLGLAHCYQIVRNHGGEIHVESRPSKGAMFEIRLPAVLDDADAPAAETDQAAP